VSGASCGTVKLITLLAILVPVVYAVVLESGFDDENKTGCPV
jgi:hypothetical protein